MSLCWIAAAAIALAALAGCSDAVTAPPVAAPRAVAPRLDVAPAPLAVTPDAVPNTADYDLGCALDGDGHVTCWSSTGGVGAPDGAAPPALPAGVRWAQLSPAWGGVCGLRTDGAAQCWSPYGGAPSLPGGPYVQIGSEGQNDFPVCGVRAADGWVVCTAAAGAETYYAPPDGGAPPAGTRYTQVSVGLATVCALDSGGGVSCWGGYWRGPRSPFPAGERFTQISASTVAPPAVCAVRTDGAVRCYDGDVGYLSFFAPTSGTFAQVSIGVAAYTRSVGNAACAVRTDGDLVCWGYGLGEGLVIAHPPGVTYRRVTLGSHAGCAVRNDGAVVAVRGFGDGCYNPPAGLDVRARQRITVTSAPPAAAVVTSTFTLAATGGGSGTPVMFASQTPGTCTTAGTNGTTLTLTAPGACTVQATQAGTADYAPAVPVTITVTTLTPAQATSQLRSAVAGSGISAAVAAGLADKLTAALAALGAGQTAAACNQLAAFQSQVQAQRGKAVPAATADAWRAQAGAVRHALGC